MNSIIWAYNGYIAYKTDNYEGKMFSWAMNECDSYYIVVQKAGEDDVSVVSDMSRGQHLVLKCMSEQCIGSDPIGVFGGFFEDGTGVYLIEEILYRLVRPYLSEDKGGSSECFRALVYEMLACLVEYERMVIAGCAFGKLFELPVVREIISAAFQCKELVVPERQIQCSGGVIEYYSCVPCSLSWVLDKPSGFVHKISLRGIFDTYPVVLGAFNGYSDGKLLFSARDIVGKCNEDVLNCINEEHRVGFSVGMLFDGQSDCFRRNLSRGMLMDASVSEAVRGIVKWFSVNPLYDMRSVGISMSMAVLGCIALVFNMFGSKDRIIDITCDYIDILTELGFVVSRDMFQKAVSHRVLNRLMMESCIDKKLSDIEWVYNGSMSDGRICIAKFSQFVNGEA